MARIAVVTGAAGGLGTAFARALAAQGYDLFLTDRDAEALERLARELAPVNVQIMVADLTVTADLEHLSARLAPMDVTLLINNAGFGVYSFFHESNLQRLFDMVGVHILATMRLCGAVLPGMVDRHSGAIINVASAAAFLRFPRDATYTGTKAFLVAFTECLAVELVGTGVAVQALCPGWVKTGFSASGDYLEVGYRSPIPRWLFTSPEIVVASSLRALGNGRVRHIPTIRTQLATMGLGSRPGQAALAWVRSRRTAY